MNEYFNIEDIQYFENLIEEYTSSVKEINSLIPSFNKKIWTIKDIPYVDEIQRIEDAIDNFRIYLYKKSGWIEKRIFTKKSSFSYRDVARWNNNLALVKEIIDDHSNKLYPSDTLYPSNNLYPR